MTNIFMTAQSLNKLEDSLEYEVDVLQRMTTIDKLLATFQYTHIRKAQKLLENQKQLLIRNPNTDLLLSYYRQAGIVGNQLYDYESAEENYLLALDLVEQIGTADQQIELYLAYVGLCINRGAYATAETYLEKSLKLLEVYPNANLSIGYHCRMGYLNLHYGDNPMAIQEFLKANAIVVEQQEELSHREYYWQSLIYSGLGTVYERVGQNEKQIKAHLQAANICEMMNIRSRMSWHYYLVGTGNLLVNDIKQAQQYFYKAINIDDDLSDMARAGAYASLGLIAANQDNNDEALNLYKRAEQLYLSNYNQSKINLAKIERLRGNIFVGMKKYQKAIDHYNKAYQHAKGEKEYKTLSGLYKDIAGCYAEMEDFENAYEYHVLHAGLAEKYTEQVKQQKIHELELRFQAEDARKQRELMRLQSVELQAKALRAQMNPHFLFNALNSIQNFVSSSDVEGADDAVRFLADFASLMRKSLDYSDKKTNTLEEELEFLKNYLEINAKLRFEDRLTYEIILSEDIEEDIMLIPTMVVQPYLENAIEHGLRNKKNGHIKVQFELFSDNQDIIQCTIKDNGIGRQARKEQQMADPRFQFHKSKGTAITEERLRLAHKVKYGDFVRTDDLVEENKVVGTQVRILLPIIDIKTFNKPNV